MTWLHFPDPLGMKEAEPPIPPELDLYVTCKRFNSLPWEGGVMDQPDITMKILTMIGNIEEQTFNIVNNMEKEANGNKSTQ